MAAAITEELLVDYVLLVEESQIKILMFKILEVNIPGKTNGGASLLIWFWEPVSLIHLKNYPPILT